MRQSSSSRIFEGYLVIAWMAVGGQWEVRLDKAWAYSIYVLLMIHRKAADGISTRSKVHATAL
jgi:hypothetical protein